MRFGAVVSWASYIEDWSRIEARDYSGPPPVPDAEIYARDMHLTDLVEPLGFDSLFVVEHHFSGYHMTNNALQHLTWIAGRTERIDLGTALIVLPWHHPVRVAEEISVLDNLLGEDRRLWLGLGRGASRREFGGFGIDMAESRDRFNESVDVLQRCFREKGFDHPGQFYDLHDVYVRPEPRTPDIADRLYVGVSSPSSLRNAAERGLKLIFTAGGPPEDTARSAANFNQIRAEHGHDPINPIVVLWMYCAPTEEMAWENAFKYITQANISSRKNYEFDKVEAFEGVAGYEDYVTRGVAMQAAFSRSGQDETQRKFVNDTLWGTPDMIIEKIRWLAEHVRMDQLVVAFNHGNMPGDLAEASLRLFAEEVIPPLRDLQPGALPTAGEMTEIAEPAAFRSTGI